MPATYYPTPVLIANGFRVPGLATVLAEPHRSLADARAFADRIACNPFDYLWAVNTYGIDGISDDRRPDDHRAEAEAEG